MIVGEIKALAPQADVYELRADARYLILVPPAQDVKVLAQALRGIGAGPGVIVRATAPADIRLFEFEQ